MTLPKNIMIHEILKSYKSYYESEKREFLEDRAKRDLEVPIKNPKIESLSNLIMALIEDDKKMLDEMDLSELTQEYKVQIQNC
jgi:hypothetical protein